MHRGAGTVAGSGHPDSAGQSGLLHAADPSIGYAEAV